MKPDRITGLHKINGKYYRVRLNGRNWEVMHIPEEDADTYTSKPIRTYQVVFKIPLENCLSATAALTEWLKTRPFK